MHAMPCIERDVLYILQSVMFYNNRETPLAGNFVGRCQGHKSDVSTQSWVLISEKDDQ